jgi:hypothetical protein
MKTINPLDIAVQTTCDAMMALRFREEVEFKKAQGWGTGSLRWSQYEIMNRFVDQVVLASPECKAYSDAKKAWNDRGVEHFDAILAHTSLNAE